MALEKYMNSPCWSCGGEVDDDGFCLDCGCHEDDEPIDYTLGDDTQIPHNRQGEMNYER